MIIKIVNKNLEDYGKEFKVRRMNYDQIIVNYPTGTGLKGFSFEDGEYTGENDIDNFLIKNREFLKIKLKRGISVIFYEALKNSLENQIAEEIISLNVLIDKYKVNKRGIWEKEMVLFLNKMFPINVIASGHNFQKNSYNIMLNKIERENFFKICNDEMERINKEISYRNKTLRSFISAIEDIKNLNGDKIKLLK